MIRSAAALLAQVVPSDNGASFAQLMNDHAVQPGARVAQVVVLLMAIFEAMGGLASHQQEHWTQAALRPVGLGAAGVGIIEVLKIAANGVLSGTLGF